MRKFSYLFAALLMTAAVFVSSCSKDEETDPGPSLNFKGGSEYTAADVTIEIGTTIKVGVLGGKSSVSGNKLTNFKLVYTANNIPTTWENKVLNTDSFDWDTTLTFQSVGAGRLTFELTDKGGMKTEKSFNVSVEGLRVKKFLDVELGSYNDSQIGSFFDADLGQVYKLDQTYGDPSNRSKIDFVFFKGAVNGNTFASPDDEALNTIDQLKVNLWELNEKNQTLFNKTTITPVEFDAISGNYDFPVFNVNNQSTRMTENFHELTEGSVFMFKTESGKLGLVKVIDWFSRGDRIKISVVVEE